MSSALKLTQIYLDLVFGAHKYKNVPHKADKHNHSESSESFELRSTSVSIKSTGFLFFILYMYCSSRLEDNFSDSFSK